MREAPILEIDDLSVTFPSADGPVHAVRGVSLSVGAGAVVGLVGESGSGKSVTMLAALGLLPPDAVISGSVRYRGRELLPMSQRELASLRGDRIAMIFQDPVSSLSPIRRVGQQVAEAIRIHRPEVTRAEAATTAVELLSAAGLPHADRRAGDYPHQLSAGMCQRVMLAAAMANDPDLLIADEPTSALDVTIQAQVLDLMAATHRTRGLAIVVVTHDLGVLAQLAQEVAVMYAGRVVERGELGNVYRRPRHPYTHGLLGAVPRLDDGLGMTPTPIPGASPSPVHPRPGCAFSTRCPHAEPDCEDVDPVLRPVGDGLTACHHAEAVPPYEVSGRRPAVAQGRGARTGQPVLSVVGLTEVFHGRGARRGRHQSAQALSGASFDLFDSETLGLVGESGCGKSTLARCVLRLIEPTGGRVLFRGQDILAMKGTQLRGLRRHLQIMFQDSAGSLDPRMRVSAILAEPAIVQGASGPQSRARAGELLEMVGLGTDLALRFPHELSGGERQRVGLARALAPGPDVVFLDEPVSALDVSVQAGVLDLLRRVREDTNRSYVLISHDLAVVGCVSDRVAVMYGGRIVEMGDCDDVYRWPAHPYTEALLSAVPVIDPACRRGVPIVLNGEPPDAGRPSTGCRFRTRCWKAQDVCAVREPPFVELGPTHGAACHFPDTSSPATTAT